MSKDDDDRADRPLGRLRPIVPAAGGVAVLARDAGESQVAGAVLGVTRRQQANARGERDAMTMADSPEAWLCAQLEPRLIGALTLYCGASESGRQESEASAKASPPAAAEPSKPSEPPEEADRTAPRPASPACEGSAAGGSARVEIRSAAPNRIGALAVNADHRGLVELLVSDGRTARLFVFDDCDIRPVINTGNGKPWLFDRGFRGAGTGVGCVAVDGQRKLIGLNIEKRGRDTVEWSRTVVDLDGRSATAGRTDEGSFDSPRNDLAIELLSQITCGDLTMVDDGVRAPAPQ